VQLSYTKFHFDRSACQVTVEFPKGVVRSASRDRAGARGRLKSAFLLCFALRRVVRTCVKAYVPPEPGPIRRVKGLLNKIFSLYLLYPWENAI
jgi:hypothetical protein